jgi:hypothetical protein
MRRCSQANVAGITATATNKDLLIHEQLATNQTLNEYRAVFGVR